MNTPEADDEEADTTVATLTPIAKLTKDLKEAAKTMGPVEIRFLVDGYYAIQEYRKASANQVRAAVEAKEPANVLQYLTHQAQSLERQISGALNQWTLAQPVGRWSRENRGLGPIITAGLMAHIDITKAPTVGHIYNFAGLNPEASWLGKEGAEALVREVMGTAKEVTMDHVFACAQRAKRNGNSLTEQAKNDEGKTTRKSLEKALARRPWNARLKVLCCIPGQFVTTKLGPRRIEEVKVGDEVLTHMGRWRPVKRVIVNHYFGDVYKLVARGNGNTGPTLTHGHPVFVRRHPMMNLNGNRWKRKSTKQALSVESRRMEILRLVDEGRTQHEVAVDLGISDACVSRYRNGKMATHQLAQTGWAGAHAVNVGGDDVKVPRLQCDFRDVMLDFTRFEGAIVSGNAVVSEGRWEDVAAPRSKSIPANVAMTDDVAWLCGFYIAEGHSSGNHLGFSTNLRKEQGFRDRVVSIIKNVLGLEGSTSVRVADNAAQQIYSCRALSLTFKRLFGDGAHSKRIPDGWITGLSDAHAEALLKGIIDGDGTTDKSGAKVITTVSADLAYGVRDLGTRLGFKVAITASKFFYKVRLVPASSEWRAVSKVMKSFYEGPVYNFEVEEDESYVVEGVAVHNCWKLGDSFCKTHNHPESFYGKLYAERKVREVQRNQSGQFSATAAATLEKKNIKDRATLDRYEAGQLPDGRVELMARRFAVKIFLSHLHLIMYWDKYQRLPPVPFAFTKGHAHFIAPRHIEEFPGLGAALTKQYGPTL